MDEALLSSPDPLNDTPTFHSPVKPRRSSRVRHSLPLQGSSPKKQTFELDVGNELSPQKIRVTVEAGDSDAENTYPDYIEGGSPSKSDAPTNRRRERTTTTTIPVKGLSDSEDESRDVATPKQGRGRPKKSTGTPVPAKKRGRAGTPTRKNGGRRKSIGDLVDGDDSDDVNFQIGKGVEISRGKGRSRSRSRSTKGTSRKSTPASRQTEFSDKLISSTTSKKGRGRRKTLLPEEVVVLEDESSGHNVDNQEAEMPGVLDGLDFNSVSPPSANSTIRSTTTIGGNEPDVTLAIFDPGNETPHRTGWSSPRIVEALIPSSTSRRADSYLSPSASPEKSHLGQYEEESVAMVPAPPSDTQEPAETENYDNDYGDGRYEEENEERFGSLHEFDTILESEGFSMISVDSVPSLREHHSSPADLPEKDLSRPLRNKNLLSVQDADTAGQNDSFSSIPDEVLEAATPGRKVQNRNLLSVQNAGLNDSFSSIPPEVLEAATPARKSLLSKLLRKKSLGMEDSFSSVAPEILEAATPARESSKRDLSAKKAALANTYEDSFSAIPSAVLDAATPAAVRQPRPNSDKLSVPGTRLSVSPANGSCSAAPRLPTPDETPSPPGETTSKHDSAPNTKLSSSRSGGRNSGENDSSIIHSHLPSSPPSIAPRRYTYTAHLRQHRQLNPDITQTPSIVFSSPSLPPPMPGARGQPALVPAPEQSQRPTLSPIVRAGRALQDVVVPSSPRSRSQSLGSPFKSPAADRKSSSSAVRQSRPSPLQERRVGPLPRLNLNGELAGLSHRRLWTSSNQQEDPFSSRTPSQPRSPSPEEKQQYSLDLPDQRRYSDPRLSSIRSEVESVRSDDAMSWQAEEEISLPEGITSISNIAVPPASLRGSLLGSERSENSAMTSEERYAAEREAVRKQISAADSSKVIVIDSDDDDVSNNHGQEDEDFGLLLETLNSSSPAVQPRQEPVKDAFEKPRRSKIPSPWRKNSKRLVYSDELYRLDSPIAERVALAKGPAKDLATEATSQPVTVRRIVTPVYSDETDPADLSGWQIPQKSNFKPRLRESNLDLSALLASPEKPLPRLTTSSRQSSFQQTSSSSQVSSSGKTREVAESSGTRSGEATGFTPIPQKSGFNPRAREELSSSPVKQTSFAPTIFGGPVKINPTRPPSRLPQPSSPVLRPLHSSSPSRTNSLPALHTPSDQLSPSVCSEEESHSSLISNQEKENQPTQNRTLKWTESLRLQSATAFIQTPLPTTSPTKSCLRSPLKTPSANYGTGNGSPSKAVTFVSSSPMPDSPVTAPLSSTKWSKGHWRLLDSILQSWKPENQSSLSCSGSSGANAEGGSRSEQPRKRRNSTRVISKLLGKKVSSQGESMRFEQWHLEAVDEFRGYVPGWEEKIIAMRVFALIVGEERRAWGYAGLA
jgi:serine/arginine repetitive matrix protein 2